ncbi:MAG: LacI family DNA-binding transcriptional regulator [Cyanobacteria bacterium P01_H01_bin.15]
MVQKRKRAHSDASMKEIAKRCDVTTSTVSNVLRNTPSGRMSDATRKRVYNEAIRCGFHTRWDQRIDASKKHIAYVIPDRSVVYRGGTFYHELLSNLRLHEETTNFRFSLYVLDRECPEKIFYRAVCEDRCDAVLLSRYGPGKMLNAVAQLLPVPLISIGRSEGLICSSIGSDDYFAGQIVAEHFFEAGFRSFAAFGDKRFNYLPRIPGFFQSLTDWGIPKESQHQFYSSDGTGIRAGQEMVDQFLAAKVEMPTGIFCNSDLIAIGAKLGFLENGVEIDKCIGIVGCDNYRDGGQSIYGITSVDWNSQHYTEVLIDLLKDTFDGGPIQHRLIPCSLKNRAKSRLVSLSKESIN